MHTVLVFVLLAKAKGLLVALVIRDDDLDHLLAVGNLLSADGQPLEEIVDLFVVVQLFKPVQVI